MSRMRYKADRFARRALRVETCHDTCFASMLHTWVVGGVVETQKEQEKSGHFLEMACACIFLGARHIQLVPPSILVIPIIVFLASPLSYFSPLQLTGNPQVSARPQMKRSTTTRDIPRWGGLALHPRILSSRGVKWKKVGPPRIFRHHESDGHRSRIPYGEKAAGRRSFRTSAPRSNASLTSEVV